MSCFCWLVVFPCSSWRPPWDSLHHKGALPAGGTSAHCLKVSGERLILRCVKATDIMNSPTSPHFTPREPAGGGAIFAFEN